MVLLCIELPLELLLLLDVCAIANVVNRHKAPTVSRTEKYLRIPLLLFEIGDTAVMRGPRREFTAALLIEGAKIPGTRGSL